MILEIIQSLTVKDPPSEKKKKRENIEGKRTGDR